MKVLSLNLSKVQHPTRHIIGYVRGNISTHLMTQPTLSKQGWRVASHSDSSQSHQAYLTMLQ